MIMKYGMEGYGLYWYCLEMIARTVEKHNLTFELEHDAEVIAHRTGIHFERVQEMMTYMVNLRLFENDRGVITCLKMSTRTDEYTQKLIGKLGPVPMLSRQNPDGVGKKSELIEENRIEENRKNNIVGLKPNGTKRIPKSDITDVVTFLNSKAGKNFQAETPNGQLTSTGTVIRNLLKSGYTVQDIKTVIARKTRQWGSDPKMQEYLRPKTLFGKQNFDNYHGECV